MVGPWVLRKKMGEFPFPPRPPIPGSPLKKLRGILKDAHSVIGKATEELHSLAKDIRGGDEEPVTPSPFRVEQEKEKELAEPKQQTPELEKVQAGTACNLCSSEHFSQASAALAEALRFARSEGLSSSEVIKRVEHARQELNAMERFDLSPSEVEKLIGKDKEVAEWALMNSRDLRHGINKLITTKQVQDLVVVAGQAERVAREFFSELWGEKCVVCEGVKRLKDFKKGAGQDVR